MISQLTIKNFGLIDSLCIEFAKGLNILTGETGAGKSILIDAVRYALGERIHTSQVRNPDQPCIVEIVFEINTALATHPILKEYLAVDEFTLIISRTYISDGRNKIKVNGRSITVAELKTIGDNLVDIHGPHDHQLLLAEKEHIKVLDSLCAIEPLKKTFTSYYEEYLALKKQLYDLKESEKTREEELDLLIYQIGELERVPLDPHKYNEYITEQTRIQNAEKLYETCRQLLDLFQGDMTGIEELLRKTFPLMKTLNHCDKSTEPFTQTLSQAQEAAGQLIADITNYLETLSFDADRAGKVNATCDIYAELIRKYGPSIEAVQKFYQTIKARYDFLMNITHNDKELRTAIAATEKELQRIASELTIQRSKTAAILKKTIEKELSQLGMPNVKFACNIEPTALNATGCDRVVFFFSPNTGEAMKPLAEIVSSGEAARVMLALKKALITVDLIPVLIFDEIDAQIGGRLGTITGKKLKELAANRQVILITHLPQIAAFADRHFKVLKKTIKSRTTTVVAHLTNTAQIEELAKMMSGERESEISRQHAYELIAKAGEG